MSATTDTIEVYHATTAAAATQIDASGFRDTPGDDHRRAGVLVAEVPLNAGDIAGPIREAWFAIDLPAKDLQGFEYQPGETDWSVWLIPADVLNGRPRRRLTDCEVELFGEADIIDTIGILGAVRKINCRIRERRGPVNMLAEGRRMLASLRRDIKRRKRKLESHLGNPDIPLMERTALTRYARLMTLIESELVVERAELAN